MSLSIISLGSHEGADRAILAVPRHFVLWHLSRDSTCNDLKQNVYQNM